MSTLGRLPKWVAAVVVVAAAALRLVLASRSTSPGHGDPSFYYTVAENLADGRGFVIDYIWHFLSKPEGITHPSNDYWMPLTSVIMSVPLLVFGKSLFVALIPCVVAGLLLAPLTFFIARTYSEFDEVRFASALAVLFVPQLLRFSLLPESSIYYALFAGSSVLCMAAGWSVPGRVWLAGLFAGLAHITRGDGVLLLGVLVLSVGFSPHALRTKLVALAAALGAYVVVLSPVLVLNFTQSGVLLPTGPSKTMFLREYSDLFSYSRELSLSSYLQWGTDNIVASKLQELASNARRIHENLGWVMTACAAAGVVFAVGRRRESRVSGAALAPLLFMVALFLFYSLIATAASDGGGFRRSWVAALPFLVVLAADAMRRLVRSRAAFLAAMSLVCALWCHEGIALARWTLHANEQLDVDLRALGRSVRADALARGNSDIVVMTRLPWELYFSTKLRAIQIPNDDLDVVHEAAQRYGADYLLLPATQKSVEGLYEGRLVDPRFPFITQVPDTELKLYRIR